MQLVYYTIISNYDYTRFSIIQPFPLFKGIFLLSSFISDEKILFFLMVLVIFVIGRVRRSSVGIVLNIFSRIFFMISLSNVRMYEKFEGILNTESF